MSYGVNPPAVAPRQRPGVVTAAAYILYGLAALSIFTMIISLSQLGHTVNVAKDAYSGIANGDAVVTILKVATVGGAVIYVILAALFVILGVFDSRGRQAMRITTWVITGLAVLCYGCGLGAGGLQGRFNGAGSTTAETQQLRDAAQRVQDAIPSWVHATTTLFSVLGLIGSAAVIILLAVPAANEYFRKPEPEMVNFAQYPPFPPVG